MGKQRSEKDLQSLSIASKLATKVGVCMADTGPLRMATINGKDVNNE